MQTKNGYPEVVLAAPCESSFFYTTADWLRHEIGISFCNKEKQQNSIYWKFYFGTGIIVLKYDPSTGISLCPAQFANATIEEKAAFKMLTDTMEKANVLIS
ncbi:hypothetical protein FAM09_00200 [Niastella caeni]|uniref:DUF3630 family protein n=1 Tax=Niastella caeni TaxID=2569763 RepID=A0A4S8HYY3_9BACT|nr:hypothetical protein [Niastella caeni]THU40571.1 hypothetical protein FAM09_00200 [Niastella caeni]